MTTSTLFFSYGPTRGSVNPLRPEINMHILLTIVHMFHDTTRENLFKQQDMSSLVIISFILVNRMFDQSVISWGELRVWSL